MTDLIDYSESDFIAWQAEREAMRAEIEMLHKIISACWVWDTHDEKWVPQS